VLMPISCERIQSVRDDIANFRFSSLRRYDDIWDDARWSSYPFTLLYKSVQNSIDENLFILRTEFTMPLPPPPHMEPRHAPQFGTSEVYMPRVFGSNRPPIKCLVLVFNQNNHDARFYDMAGAGNDTESLIRLSQSYESTNKKLPNDIKALFAVLGGDSSLMNKRSRKSIYPWVREIAKQKYNTLTL
jgi:hypothetical protein